MSKDKILIDPIFGEIGNLFISNDFNFHTDKNIVNLFKYYARKFLSVLIIMPDQFSTSRTKAIQTNIFYLQKPNSVLSRVYKNKEFSAYSFNSTTQLEKIFPDIIFNGIITVECLELYNKQFHGKNIFLQPTFQQQNFLNSYHFSHPIKKNYKKILLGSQLLLVT